MDSDGELLARVASGDERGLRRLYERHAGSMLRLLYRLTSDRGIAEELLQETWLAVWTSATSYQASASVRAWLLGVTRRQAHNRLRRPQVSTVEIETAPEPADTTTDVEAQVLAAAGHEEILAAIGRLPETHREVVMFALVEELPYADIAEVMGVPVGTVKSRMAKARRLLAAQMPGERVN